jgi:hypothetical protein
MNRDQERTTANRTRAASRAVRVDEAPALNGMLKGKPLLAWITGCRHPADPGPGAGRITLLLSAAD